MPLERGTRLGAYEVLEHLGAGGMGEVYRAHDVRLGRDVALKVLTSERSLDKEAMARFEREARTASALNHPHIVNIYETGEAPLPGGPVRYIAMELVEGRTLRQRLRDGERWKSLTEPLAQVADALARAHKAGIVHRDLKPENVMITPDGYPKLLDFGLAKLVEAVDPASLSESDPTESFDGLTQAGAVLGTPAYMSPEQVRGKPLDHRSDVFSFGCILYETATGQRPFKGETSVATLHAILQDDPPAIESLNAEAPAELRRIVQRCLAKDPEQRYQTIKDVANDLRSLARSAEPPRPRERGRFLAVIAALLVVAAVAIAVRLRRPAAPPSAPGGIVVQRLTNRGVASNPAISPDGRSLAYSSVEDERALLLLRDLAEGTETRLGPGLQLASVGRLRFGKDSRVLYANLRERDRAEGLYRVSLVGGEPRLVHTGGGRFELSPDEKRVAFKRSQEGGDVLVVADLERGDETVIGQADTFAWSPGGALLFSRQESLFARSGTEERRVAGLEKETRCRWPRPDDAAVLCSVPKGPRDSQLVEVDLKKGTARPVGERLWRQINDLHWLPDAGGFVLNEVVEERQALYSVSYPEGRVTQVPADSHKYWGLSMTPDGTKLVSQQTIGRADVLVSRDPERGSFKKVLSGTNVNYRFSWTPDGKLVYSSNEGGSYDLYVSDADGSNRKQLTFDRDRDEREPAASPDGRHIVFVSNRSGEWQLYRIDRDGTGLRRLTDERVYRERDPRITSDGRSVLYRRWDNGPSLWKVPIEGGTPTLVRGVRPSSADGKIEIAFGASAAPDGKALAFLYFTMDSKRGGFSPAEIAIGSIDGDLVKRLPYLDSHQGGINDDQRVQWSHDGSTLYYNRFEGPGIVWKRPAAGGPPIQVTRFEEAARYFDWSPDGKTLAVSRMSSLSDIVLITNFR